MKADILRRAEEISDDDDEGEDAEGGKAIAFEDELDDEGTAVKVRDGDASDEAEGEDVAEGAEGETSVCLASFSQHGRRSLTACASV